MAWEASSNHLIWAAASRAVRTPSRVDRDTFSPPLVPNPAYGSEVAQVYELGWRGRPAAGTSVSATLFHHRFDKLRSFDISPTGVGTFNNNYRGHLSGVETWGEWQVAPTWRLQASYTYQQPRYQAAPGTAPLPVSSSLGNDARHQAMLTSAWTLPHGMEVDLRARRVGERPSPLVPAYTAVDARWAWRFRREWEVAATVTNLNGSHAEFGAPASRAVIDRGAYVQVTWRP